MTKSTRPNLAIILLVKGMYIGELGLQTSDRSRLVTFLPTNHSADPINLALVNGQAPEDYLVLIHEVDPEVLQLLVSTDNSDLLGYYAEEWFGDERFITQAEFVLAADRRMQLYLKHPTLDKLSGLQALGETIYVPVKAARVQGINPLLGEYVALRRSQVREDQVQALQGFIDEQLKAADLAILQQIDHLNAQPIAEPDDAGLDAPALIQEVVDQDPQEGQRRNDLHSDDVVHCNTKSGHFIDGIFEPVIGNPRKE